MQKEKQKQIVIGPASKKQELFLNSDATITLAGGVFYVYVHKKADNGEIFYVGKGTGHRYKSPNSRSDYWKNVKNKHGFFPEIVFDNMSEEDSLDCEKKLISYYREEFSLVNLTDGGEGLSGFTHSESVKLKMSQARKGVKKSKEMREKLSASTVGKSYSEETIRKMSTSKIGKKHSDETKKKISSSLLGKIKSEVSKTKCSLSNSDNRVYVFEHSSGLVEICTRNEMCSKYKINKNTLKNLFSSNPKSAKGWSLGRIGNE